MSHRQEIMVCGDTGRENSQVAHEIGISGVDENSDAGLEEFGDDNRAVVHTITLSISTSKS